MNIYSGISSLDSYGNPKNFIDEDNIYWVYQGKRDGIDYWCKHRYKVYVCASCGNGCCHDLVGAHVQKVNSNDKKWYIVPLCKSCNQKNEPFNVDDDMLVPVPSNM